MSDRGARMERAEKALASLAGAPTDNERQDAYQALFELVEDPADWRGPIDMVVPAKFREAVTEAVYFFTATPTTFEELPGEYVRARSVGYRNGPAGP